MAIRFRCGKCNEFLHTPDGTAGKQARCPGCRGITIVPSSVADSAEPPKAKMPTSNDALEREVREHFIEQYLSSAEDRGEDEIYQRMVEHRYGPGARDPMLPVDWDRVFAESRCPECGDMVTRGEKSCGCKKCGLVIPSAIYGRALQEYRKKVKKREDDRRLRERMRQAGYDKDRIAKLYNAAVEEALRLLKTRRLGGAAVVADGTSETAVDAPSSAKSTSPQEGVRRPADVEHASAPIGPIGNVEDSPSLTERIIGALARWGLRREPTPPKPFATPDQLPNSPGGVEIGETSGPGRGTSPPNDALEEELADGSRLLFRAVIIGTVVAIPIATIAAIVATSLFLAPALPTLKVFILVHFVATTYVTVATMGFMFSGQVAELRFPELSGRFSAMLGQVLGYFLVVWLLSARVSLRFMFRLGRSLVRSGFSWERRSVRLFVASLGLCLLPLVMYLCLMALFSHPR